MPDVRVCIPHTLFHGVVKDRRNEVRKAFPVNLAHAVAKALKCADSNGEPSIIDYTDIDVYVMSYKSGEVSIYGPPVLITIVGYDYPERMANIKDRLTTIQKWVTGFLTNAAYFKADGAPLATVSFIPIPEGCWV